MTYYLYECDAMSLSKEDDAPQFALESASPSSFSISDSFFNVLLSQRRERKRVMIRRVTLLHVDK